MQFDVPLTMATTFESLMNQPKKKIVVGPLKTITLIDKSGERQEYQWQTISAQPVLALSPNIETIEI